MYLCFLFEKFNETSAHTTRGNSDWRTAAWKNDYPTSHSDPQNLGETTVPHHGWPTDGELGQQQLSAPRCRCKYRPKIISTNSQLPHKHSLSPHYLRKWSCTCSAVFSCMQRREEWRKRERERRETSGNEDLFSVGGRITKRNDLKRES